MSSMSVLSIDQSVYTAGNDRALRKTSDSIEIPFAVVGMVHPRNHVFR